MTTPHPVQPLPDHVAADVASQVEAASQVRPSLPHRFAPDYSDPDYEVRQWFLDQMYGEREETSTVSRADLTRSGGALTPDSSDEDLRAFLLLVNAWGFGTSGFGPWRTQRVLASERFLPSARRTLEILHAGNPDAAVRAYFYLNNKSQGKVPWWGPAFFTKFLAFADPANSTDSTKRQGALILDRWMAKAVRDIAEHNDFPDWGWTTPQYAYYLTLMARLRETPELHGVASTVDVERALFAWYTGR